MGVVGGILLCRVKSFDSVQVLPFDTAGTHQRNAFNICSP